MAKNIFHFPNLLKSKESEKAALSVDLEAEPKRMEVTLPHNWRAWNDAKFIKESLGRVERDRVQQLQYSWPNLHVAVHRLALQLTPVFPGAVAEKGLLAETVEKAFAAYDDKKTKTSDVRAPIAFMKELALSANKVLEYTVLGETEDGARVHWSPFKTPMSDWIRRNNVVKLIFEPTKDYESLQPDAPKLLGHEILDTEDMLMMSERLAW